MRVVLVRHGAPQIAPGLCYGRLDVPLTPQAAAKLPGMARRLARHGAARIWTSPARRCRDLAAAVAGLAAIPLVVDERLVELDFGAWEGMAWDAVPREALDRWAADPAGFAPPGGETGQALLDRVAAAWDAVRGAGEDCVLVSHGGPLRLLVALARGTAPDLLGPDLLAAPPPLESMTLIDA